MKKYRIIIIITLLLTFGISPTVFATQNSTSQVLSAIAKTNATIEKMIEAAIQKGSDLQNKYLQDVANVPNNAQKTATIAAITQKYNSDLNKLIDDLITSTNSKATQLIIKAAQKGVAIDSTYVEVTIGSTTILVDPCRVRSI